MEEEMFDIVDADNNPTGQVVSRSEAHAQGLWHRVAHIYFYRPKNGGLEFLVHLRAKTKESAPDRWDTRFGGHVMAGMDTAATALRELKEEAGLEVKAEDLEVGPWRQHDSPSNREYNQVYFYKFAGEAEDLHFADGEVQEAKWLPAEAIVKSMQENPEKWAGSLKGFQEIWEFLRKL